MRGGARSATHYKNAPVVIAHYIPSLAAYGQTVAGYKLDIQDAQAAGVDAFVLDEFGWAGTSNDFSTMTANIFEAALELGTGFKLFLMSDSFGSSYQAAAATAAGTMLTAYASHPNYLYYQGRPMFSAWDNNVNPTNGSTNATYWATVKSAIAGTGLNPFFIPAFGEEDDTFAQINTWWTTGTWLPAMVDGILNLSGQIPAREIGSNDGMSKVMASAGKAFAAGVQSWFAPIRFLSLGQVASNVNSIEFNGGEGLASQWMDIIGGLTTGTPVTVSSTGAASQAASGTTATTTATVASGVTALLGLLWLDVSSAAPTMHWDSAGTNQSMTIIGSIGNGIVNTYLFGLLAPTVGVGLTLGASWTGSSGNVLASQCYIGTATDTLANAFKNLRTNTGSSTAGTVTSAGAVGNINVCAMGAGTVPSWSGIAATGSTQSVLQNTDIAATAAYAPSASSLVWTATLSATNPWTAMAIDVSAPVATPSVPKMVYIITWNDYTESYMGPASQANLTTNNLGSWQVTGDYLFTHAGFTELNKYFIKWFKTGQQPVWPDAMYVFYRNAPMSMVATVAPAGTGVNWTADGGTTLDDLYITTILTATATLNVTTAGTLHSSTVPAGITHTRVPFAVGTQTFALVRSSTTIISITGANVVSSETNYYNVNPLSYYGYSP